MYKLIACDLDETLVDSNGEVSEENIEAINKVREMGVKFVPISGRDFYGIGFINRTLGVEDAPGEYTIACNGALIYENKDMNLISSNCLPYEIANELYKKGLNYDVGIHIYTKNGVYVANIFPEEREYLSNRLPITEIDSSDLSFLDKDSIAKLIFVNTDYDYLQWVEKDLDELAPDLEIAYSANRYLELNYSGVNKQSGIEKLSSILGIPIEETMAIGDGINDLSMIEGAGLGVGVKNSYEEILPACDYVTKATNDESAVAEVIEKFILNENGDSK